MFIEIFNEYSRIKKKLMKDYGITSDILSNFESSDAWKLSRHKAGFQDTPSSFSINAGQYDKSLKTE